MKPTRRGNIVDLDEDIDYLKNEVERLAREVTEIRAELSASTRERKPTMQLSPTDPMLAEIIRVTKELFPGVISLETIVDPADPDDQTVVFQVSSRDTVRKILEQRAEWHRRIAELPSGSSGHFSLSVVPIE